MYLFIFEQPKIRKGTKPTQYEEGCAQQRVT